MLELDSVAVDARGFEVSASFNGVTAVVGPNGAGKSTLLGLVAGALRPDRGTVVIDGEVVAGDAAFVPAHRRRCAYLEQRALLFPHLRVLDNVAFGAPVERARLELAAVGCADLGTRRPRELSGGQAQRVALARALAIDPRVVLLDEPLAALDASVVPELRAALRERLAGRTALLVTHDLVDVLTLAERIVVLDGGRVVAAGTVADACARPTSGFLADLVGTNLLAGVATHTGVDVGGLELVGDARAPVGAAAFASVPPNAISLHRTAPGGSPRNALPVVVEKLEQRGALVRVWLALGQHRLGADLTASAVAELGIVPGERLVAAVKATQVTVYTRP